MLHINTCKPYLYRNAICVIYSIVFYYKIYLYLDTSCLSVHYICYKNRDIAYLLSLLWCLFNQYFPFEVWVSSWHLSLMIS